MTLGPNLTFFTSKNHPSEEDFCDIWVFFCFDAGKKHPWKKLIRFRFGRLIWINVNLDCNDDHDFIWAAFKFSARLRFRDRTNYSDNCWSHLEPFVWCRDATSGLDYKRICTFCDLYTQYQFMCEVYSWLYICFTLERCDMSKINKRSTRVVATGNH